MFNSAEYSWNDLEVVMLGRPVVRLLEVKYKVTTETKEIYGRGGEPLGIQEGNSKYEGELKIGQSELEALIAKARTIKPGINPTRMPAFNISVMYSKDGVITRDVLVGVKIHEFEKALKQGDFEMEVSLPFKFLQAKLGV